MVADGGDCGGLEVEDGRFEVVCRRSEGLGC